MEQRRVTVTARSFTTPEGQALFQAAYDASLARWPVPFERFDVPTRFGPTHVIAAGPVDAPPLILLHAFLFGSAGWYANIGEWSRHYRVYALDTMGDVNNSVLQTPIGDRSQFALWLGDAMDALRVQSAPLVGHSYGGWIALNMALCAPERVERVVLLAPAASFVKFAPRFGFQTLLLLLFRKRWSVNSFVRWVLKPGNEAPGGLVEQLFQGMCHFKWGAVPRPNVYTDAELGQINAPVLLLFGDHEVIEDWRAAQERARRLMPHVQTDIIANASHALVTEQPEAINRRVLQFLTATGEAAS